MFYILQLFKTDIYCDFLSNFQINNFTFVLSFMLKFFILFLKEGHSQTVQSPSPTKPDPPLPLGERGEWLSKAMWNTHFPDGKRGESVRKFLKKGKKEKKILNYNSKKENLKMVKIQQRKMNTLAHRFASSLPSNFSSSTNSIPRVKPGWQALTRLLGNVNSMSEFKTCLLPLQDFSLAP